MIETLYMPYQDRRYVVSAAGSIKLVTYNRKQAEAIDKELLTHKNPGEFWLIVSKQPKG